MEKYGQMTKIAIDTSQMFMQNPNALKPETQKSIIGYMLVSQIEAVEAIQDLNKQVRRPTNPSRERSSFPSAPQFIGRVLISLSSLCVLAVDRAESVMDSLGKHSSNAQPEVQPLGGPGGEHSELESQRFEPRSRCERRSQELDIHRAIRELRSEPRTSLVFQSDLSPSLFLYAL